MESHSRTIETAGAQVGHRSSRPAKRVGYDRLDADAKRFVRLMGLVWDHTRGRWTRGMTIADYIRSYFPDGRWRGDVCGCIDDRCFGHHHDFDERCGCLPVLLGDAMRRAGFEVGACGDCHLDVDERCERLPVHLYELTNGVGVFGRADRSATKYPQDIGA